MKTNRASVPIAGSSFVLVGGASLVGSATAELLLREGAASVRILDNFAFGSREAIAHVVGDPRVSVIQADVQRLPQLIDAFQAADGVLHLAAAMTISMDRDPWNGLDVNVRGAQNCIEACRIAKVRKLVFASSNAVYGYGSGVKGDLIEGTPFHSEGAPPAAVLYGASKIIGEQLCRAAHRAHGLDYVVLRYSTVYGERQHYRAANALYIIETYDSIKAGRRPKIVGDGSETKHFVYVGDLARANLRAFESDASDVAVNASGPSPITTLELVKLVIEVTGSKLEPEFVAPDPTKVRLTSGGAFEIDHALAEKTIGWRPEVGMREGIDRLVKWIEKSGGTKT